MFVLLGASVGIECWIVCGSLSDGRLKHSGASYCRVVICRVISS